MQWIADSSRDGRGGDQARPQLHPAASAISGGSTGSGEQKRRDDMARKSVSDHPAAPSSAPRRSNRDAFDALATTMAIKNALRLQSMGFRPGVMGGSVGLLQGLRTPDMDKYEEVRAYV